MELVPYPRKSGEEKNGPLTDCSLSSVFDVQVKNSLAEIS